MLIFLKNIAMKKQNEPWPYPFPAQSRGAIFLEPPVRTSSPGAIRRFPLSPLAAPAAGGWGNPGSRSVYSVGSSRYLPAASRRGRRGRWGCFAAVFFLFHGGVLRNSSMVRLLCPRSRLPGAVVRVLPLPESEVWRIRALEEDGGDGDTEHGDGDGGAGWRLSGAEIRRLPVRRGTPSNPRHEWRSCGGAPAVRPARRRRHRVPVWADL